MYDLYGVVYHQGQLNGGHYRSACRLTNGEWWSFNDESRHLLNGDGNPQPKNRVVSPFAYVLFYKKRFLDTETPPLMWETWNE
jgi:ubiquitin C-terminal hydrolase